MEKRIKGFSKLSKQAKMEWLAKAPLTPNEIRYALKYDSIMDDGMDTVWIDSNKQRITDVSMTAFDQANL